MKRLTAFFSFNGNISRIRYITIAGVGVLLKHLVDFAVASAFHRQWDYSNYLLPVGVPVFAGNLPPGDIRFLTVLLAVSLPFAYVGLLITVKRFRTIGWPTWCVVLFFVPIANIASFALAAAWPERDSMPAAPSEVPMSKFVPPDPFGAAVFALVLTSLLGTAFVWLGTLVLGSYGWGLFAAIPFAQGAVAAYAYGMHGRRTVRASVSVALLSIVLTGAALLALALEGVFCILMALPIALAFAGIGALFGHSLGRRPLKANVAMAFVGMFLAPGIMGAEAVLRPVAPTFMVTTSLDIAAPPALVWRNVVSFPDLPPPKQPAFRLGIAYPERARIVGRGVGAVRYCIFSTGEFVEPITAWQPNRRLAFSVVRSPEPMSEWSPYGHLNTPHLHNYMVSRHGEFLLEPLEGGRTRLTGATWYQHHLWPAAYWKLWSDTIVHAIHYRVLEHIKTLSEEEQARPTF